MLAGVGGFALVVFGKVFQFGVRLGRIEDRLERLQKNQDAMWTFQMQRGKSAGLNDGLLVMNSPPVPVPEAIEWFEPLKSDLAAFYREFGTRGMTDEQLMLEIQKKFGAVIVDMICTPRKLNEGTCLIIALYVAKLAAIGVGGFDLADKP